MSSLRVCIIGGGAGGLCVARHLSAQPQHFSYDIFERSDSIGGTWVYTDQTGTDKYGQPIHSSMYKHLRTNLPKEVMAFPGFPFSKSLPSFIHHTEVQKYLEEYSQNYKLLEHVKFLHSVESVKPLLMNQEIESGSGNNPSPAPVGPQWEVMVKNVKSGHRTSSTYDAVFVSNGHYSVPKLPDIPGQSTFTGHILHSHNYRSPTDDMFTANSTVVCLGAGSSGVDIAVEISKHVKQVYLVHRRASPLVSVLPSNLDQISGGSLSGVEHDTVSISRGGQAGDPVHIQCDVIILCTGYHFTYPFLEPECGVRIVDERVTPLYKHLVNIHHPSMYFIGVPLTICPFPLFDVQVRFSVQVLLGRHRLPSESDMLADTEREYRERTVVMGLPHRHAHKMGTLQWAYNDNLCELAGLQRLEPVIQRLYDHVHEYRVKDLCSYKSGNYKLVSSETYEVVK